MSPADGECIEIKALVQDYRCAQWSMTPIDLEGFLDEIENCSKLGIEIEVGDDQRVYCLDVKLGSVMARAAH